MYLKVAETEKYDDVAFKWGSEEGALANAGSWVRPHSSFIVCCRAERWPLRCLYVGRKQVTGATSCVIGLCY